MSFDSLKQSLRQWQDSRRAEKNARHDAKHGTPTTKVLNERLIEALDNGWQKTAAQALEQGGSADARRFYQYGASNYTYPVISHEIMRNNRANIDLLLKHAPDLNTQDSLTGHTPLIEAVIHGQTPIVRLLLDAGVALDIRTSIHSKENINTINCMTAQDIAAARGYDDIEEMLKAEPQRRKDAAQAARQAAAEAAQKAAAPKPPAAPAEIVVKTDQSIKVSGPLRFKNQAKPKKWFQF